MHEDPAVNEWRRRVAEAKVGWLPPAAERMELDSDVMWKCLGIDSQGWLSLTVGQRFELWACFFAGREREIPYEEWGLERPDWIPPAPESPIGRK